MSNKAADRAVHLQVARIGAEGKADRRDAQVSKLMLDQIKEFNNREDIKQLRTSLGSMSKFDTLLQDGSATGFNLSKLALIKMAQGTGVVTEEDAKKAEGSPDYASQVMRAISLKTTGTPLKEDRDTFQRIAGALTSKAQERLLRKAKAFSSSKGPYIPGQNAESFHQALVRGVQDEMTSEDNGTPEATAPEGRTPQVPVGRPQTQEPQAAPQSRMMQFIKK
jgi:hypothetical protein